MYIPMKHVFNISWFISNVILKEIIVIYCSIVFLFVFWSGFEIES